MQVPAGKPALLTGQGQFEQLSSSWQWTKVADFSMENLMRVFYAMSIFNGAVWIRCLYQWECIWPTLFTTSLSSKLEKVVARHQNCWFVSISLPVIVCFDHALKVWLHSYNILYLPTRCCSHNVQKVIPILHRISNITYLIYTCSNVCCDCVCWKHWK